MSDKTTVRVTAYVKSTWDNTRDDLLELGYVMESCQVTHEEETTVWRGVFVKGEKMVTTSSGDVRARKCYQCRTADILDDPLEQYCKGCLQKNGDGFWNNRIMVANGHAMVTEVHYDGNGRIVAFCIEPKALVGNNLEDLHGEFEQVSNMMLHCNPVLRSHKQFVLDYKKISAAFEKK